MKLFLPSTLLLALGALLASCSNSSSEVTVDHQALASGQSTTMAGTQAVELLVPSSQRRIVHSGIREVATHEWDEGVEHIVRYREKVCVNGIGQYSIIPIEALEGVEPDWATFRLIQLGRQGQIHKYRDFLIRDAALFGQNWTLTDLLQTEPVAGRTCARYSVERVIGTPHTFELWVDVSTDLLLRYEESDEQDRLVSVVSFESVNYNPDFGTVIWHYPEDRDPVDFSQNLRAQLGFEPVFPQLIPAGYDFHSAEIATVSDEERWVSAKYLDGAEPLFFLERFRRSELSIGPSTTPQGPGTPIGGEMSQMVVFRVGAATAVQGTVDGHELTVVGQVSDAEILDMIESSLD